MSFLPELGPRYPERAAAVGLRHEDVEENFILGSGHGGQNRNKRSTAVQLVHHPSGTEVRCFHKRMQHQNRMDAWERLLILLEEKHHEQDQKVAHDVFVKRAQRRGRTRMGRERTLEEKRQRGEIKSKRKPLNGR